MEPEPGRFEDVGDSGSNGAGRERPRTAAGLHPLDDDDDVDSTPSSGFGVIVLLSSHST